MPAPSRIVSLQPSATSILAALGELDRLVACTRYCAAVVPELTRRTRMIVADSWTAKSQEILAAQPDLVLAAVPYQLEAVAEILKAGIRFLGLAPKTLSDIYTDIAVIAGCVGAASRGEAVISVMQSEIERVRSQTQLLPRRRVFCEEWGKPIIASQPWVAELVDAAGGDFLAQPGQHMPAEEVAGMKPDVLIAAWCGAGNRVPLEKLIRERHWSHLPAVQHARVFCIPDEHLNTPSPALLHGLHALAAAIHPEGFPLPPSVRQLSGVPTS